MIVASCESYRTKDFVAAARGLRHEVVVATDAPSPFGANARMLLVDLDEPPTAARSIVEAVPDAAAVIAVDDQGVRAAGLASKELGHPTNPQQAIEATRDKLAMRRLIERAGLDQPAFTAVPSGTLAARASEIGFPAVVKPVGLSGSRGVIRLDSAAAAAAVEHQIRRIVAARGGEPDEELIVEQYIDGAEIVVEGLVHRGALHVLAMIDKPIPLVGPYFEETMFVTPSVLPARDLERAVGVVEEALGAVGIVTGPVHAELRIDAEGKPWLIEIAARSIGGLCGRSLSFGLLGESLESVIISAAVGRSATSSELAAPSSGVLMVPIPATGTLTSVDGVDRARELALITDIELTVSRGSHVAAAPEGDRYIGFVFAVGPDPGAVTTALSEAAGLIEAVVDGESVSSQGQSDASAAS